MVIRKWDPLRDLLSLQERLNRLFEAGLTPAPADMPELPSSRGWLPLADVHDTGAGFTIEVELPGVEAREIELTIDKRTVVLKGERHPLPVARPESFHRMERSYGTFARTFELPEAVDPDRVHAQLESGLLRVELAKAPHRAGPPRRVRVEPSE